MHVTSKCSLALLVASLLGSTSLMASEWSTVAARATAEQGYEVRANQFRVAKVPLDYFAGLQAGASELTLPLPDGGGHLCSGSLRLAACRSCRQVSADPHLQGAQPGASDRDRTLRSGAARFPRHVQPSGQVGVCRSAAQCRRLRHLLPAGCP